MKTISEESPEFIALANEFQRRMAALVSGIPARREGLLLSAGGDVSALTEGNEVLQLVEGVLPVLSGDRELFLLEEGDLLLAVGDRSNGLTVQSEFAVRFNLFDIDRIAQGSDAVEQLLGCLGIQQAMMAHLLLVAGRGERRLPPALRSVAQGEVFIREGEISDQVFTLVEGRAEVLSGGRVVGEVLPDELVGVIGALCGVPRIATVRATSDCLLMALGREEFIELLSLRPQTVVKLIADFARIIASGNEALRALPSGTRV